MALHTVTALFLACVICQASCSLLEVLRRSDAWLAQPVLRATESENVDCERISEALDNLWNSIPEGLQIEDMTPRRPEEGGPSGELKEFLANAYTEYAPQIGFNTPSNNIDTHEGREEVACKLAGVHNLDDFMNLFGDNVPKYYLRMFYNKVQMFFRGDLGMAALEDLRELLKIDFYFKRITGFPNFPLDIYDIDMARYIVQREKAHTLTWRMMGDGENILGHTDEEWVQALMSDSLEDVAQLGKFPINPHLSSEELKTLMGKMLKLYSIVPKGIDVVEALYENGFFGTTATTG